MTLGELRKRFSVQRSDAKRRGIPFLLTFDQWLNIWKTSGKLSKRGHGYGRYVMSRYGDRGGYELGNVRVILFEENCKEYSPTLDARKRIGLAHRGKFVSLTTRKKIAAKAKVRTYSPETRIKLSINAKRIAQLKDRDNHGRFA